VNSLTLLALLAAFSLGYAASEFYRAWLERRERRAQAALIHAMMVADHIQMLVRIGLIEEVGPGHYHRTDIPDNEAEAILLANGLDPKDFM
jgi:hypothetical protein